MGALLPRAGLADFYWAGHVSLAGERRVLLSSAPNASAARHQPPGRCTRETDLQAWEPYRQDEIMEVKSNYQDWIKWETSLLCEKAKYKII